jgi:hypothetical protein
MVTSAESFKHLDTEPLRHLLVETSYTDKQKYRSFCIVEKPASGCLVGACILASGSGKFDKASGGVACQSLPSKILLEPRRYQEAWVGITNGRPPVLAGCEQHRACHSGGAELVYLVSGAWLKVLTRSISPAQNMRATIRQRYHLHWNWRVVRAGREWLPVTAACRLGNFRTDAVLAGCR